jgi:hypothetical protein
VLRKIGIARVGVFLNRDNRYGAKNVLLLANLTTNPHPCGAAAWFTHVATQNVEEN